MESVFVPTKQAPSRSLGTNIIEALAKRLDAEVEVTNAKPGTAVSIVHAPIASVGAAGTVR